MDALGGNLSPFTREFPVHCILYSVSLSIYALEEHLGKQKQHPTSNSDQQPPSKKSKPMSPQCRQFVGLIIELSVILSKDPEPEAVLRRMKLSLATLNGLDDSISIEKEVYHSAKTVEEFFEVMARYWNCYDDHALLETLIKSTHNKESIGVVNTFLQNSDPGMTIPQEKCPKCPFQSPCSGESNDPMTAMGKDGDSSGNSLQPIADAQHIFSSISQDSLRPEESKSLQRFHYHPDCSNALPPNRVPFLAKAYFSQINGRTYGHVKGIIATVLKMPRAVMSLWGIYPGCCVVVWHVSREIAAGIKKIKLSPDDEMQLLQCAILMLSCDNKCLFTFPKEKLVCVCVCVCVLGGE